MRENRTGNINYCIGGGGGIWKSLKVGGGGPAFGNIV